MKKYWLLLFTTLPVVVLSMETAIILEAPSKTEAQMVEDVYSPHYRFVNSRVVSNLRFIQTQEELNFRRPFHYQHLPFDIGCPCDDMTHVVHLLCPSPSGDYLVANQTRDVIGITSPLQFYEALKELKRNPHATVWDVFSIMFSRHLLESAKEFIEHNIVSYNINEYGSAVYRFIDLHKVPMSECLKRLANDSPFQGLDFKSGDLGLFVKSLRKNNLFNEKVAREKAARLRFLEGQITNIHKNKALKEQYESELLELQNLDGQYLTPQDFQGYRFAYAFKQAFHQQQRGEYPRETLDQMVSVYLWQKANSKDDLPFLSDSSLRSPIETRAMIRAIVESPERLRMHYDQDDYDIVWAYIYREQLMLDGDKLPLIHYRSIKVDGYTFSDCFETSLRNATNYFCFQNGSFKPEVWKEGSLLRQYYSQFSMTNPSDSNARSEWGKYVARIPDVHYYTPSKKMNDAENTHEAIPGFFNMMRILCHLGDADVATQRHLSDLQESFESIDDSHLSGLFSMMISDITQAQVDEKSMRFDGLNALSERTGRFRDYGGELILQHEGQLEAKLDIRPIHAIFSFKNIQGTIVDHSDIACNILEDLPLFKSLRADYRDKSTLLRSAVSPEEVTSLLMKFDLKSPDVRREILPVLLEKHAGLPLVKKILLAIKRENDLDERNFVGKILQENVVSWFLNVDQRNSIIDLIQCVPTLLTSDTIRMFLVDENSPLFEWGIYLLNHAEGYVVSEHDAVMLKYVDNLKHVRHLCCVPFIDSMGQILEVKDFKFLEFITVTYYPEGDLVKDINNIISQIPSWVESLPQTIHYISFGGYISENNYLTCALAIKKALEDSGKISVDFHYTHYTHYTHDTHY
ncbi:MAG: hypothetical protein C0432_01905 [Candidatus Puniceispirillum sp.]|nr:hypothetical protein [Candidatus Pelagibacter sp.]MBA4283029.1 hypothetical protein [Candidatus Puniceispirillum sp.]